LVLKRFIYYSNYGGYSMATTIQISNETKELIGSFGTKSDTYEDIIKKIYKMAVKEQLRELLMSSEKAIPIDEAIKKAKKEWQ